MNLVLDQRKTGGGRRKSKNRLQSRFEKLRSTLERQRRRNTRFRHDLDELVEMYHRHSIENDKAVFDDLVALSGKLIKFAGRKSLSQWHRRELGEWLMDLIERRISQVDREVAATLRTDYREAVARSMDISVDQLVEWLEAESESIDPESAEQDESESAEDMHDSPWQEDMFGFEDLETEEAEAFDADYGENEPDWMDYEEEADIGQSIMDGSWAKDLFRRAAQVLHPDREPDPERRQAKQQCMCELLKARKQGDIMTMLTIYSENVSGADVVLAEHEMTAVCNALEQQLEALELEKHGYIYSHPIRHMVFDLFYHNSEKVRKRRISEWKQELDHEGETLRNLAAFLRNLASLKTVLEDRRNERAAMLVDTLFEDFRF
jgi:hypothetical protein